MQVIYSSADFINTKRSSGTKEIVTNVFVSFFQYINNLEKVENIDTFSIQYLESERDFFKDVLGYIDNLLSIGRAPNTISSYVSFICSWLEFNKIVFDAVQKSIINNKKPRAVVVHDEDYLDISRIQSILSHSDILIRTIILFLVSSGMRVGECLSIESHQVHGNEIHLSAAQMKASKPHVYFVSKEALKSLAEWNKVKLDFIRLSYIRNTQCLRNTLKEASKSEGLIFPFSYRNINVKFNNVLKKAGLYELDENIHRSRITLHSIRKFTDSTMKIYISSNLANSLIGHFEPGDSSYRRYTPLQMREAYAKVEPYLTVQAPEDYAELQSETRQELASQSKLLLNIAEENIEIKKKLASFERVLSVLDKLEEIQ